MMKKHLATVLGRFHTPFSAFMNIFWEVKNAQKPAMKVTAGLVFEDL